MSDLEEPKPGISRRTVAKGMAWSVPAIALAVSTPAYAASPGIITLTGDGCKLPGASQGDVFKGYAFRATLTNTTNADIEVTIVDITLDGEDLGGVTVVGLTPCDNLGNPFTVPADTTSMDVAILTEDFTNSSTGLIVVSYTVDGGPVQTASATANVDPIQNPQCTFSDTEAACILSVASPDSVIHLIHERPGRPFGLPGFRV